MSQNIDIKNIEEYFKRWEEDKDAKGSKGTLFLFFVNRAGKNKMTSHLKKDFFEYLRISDGRASDTLQKFLGTFYVKCRSNGCDFVFTDDDIIAQNTRSADEALANIMNKIWKISKIGIFDKSCYIKTEDDITARG